MNCPVDGTTLHMSQRSGIEIDYCPQCRGVWLDRGELDKILDREAQLTSGRYDDDRDDDRRPRSRDDFGGEYRDDRDGRDYRDDRGSTDGRGQPQRRRRGGFLGDLFEGFGGD